MTQTPTPTLEGIILPTQPEGPLVSIPDVWAPLDLFTVPGIIPSLLGAIRQEAYKGYSPSIESEKERKAITSQAFRVTRTKTALDDLGKKEVERLKALPKKVDEARKELRDGLDLLRDELRAPLAEWEAEQVKIGKILIDVQNLPAQMFGRSALEMVQHLSILEGMNPEAFGERSDEFEKLRRVTVATLQQQIEDRQTWEKEQLELEALRREKAQRDKEAREEQLRKEGEARARAQMDAPALPPPPPATPQAAPIAPALPPAPASLPGTGELEHRRKYNREALADLLLLCDGKEEYAKAVLLDIIQGKVRHLSMTY